MFAPVPQFVVAVKQMSTVLMFLLVGNYQRLILIITELTKPEIKVCVMFFLLLGIE
jgi:hypothetical protein